MITKTMVDIAQEILEKQDSLSFDNLWEQINEAKKLEFQKISHDKKITMSKIVQDQRAEFYTILTVDGRFLRLKNADWALAENFSVEEKEKLRVSYAQTSEE